MRFCPIETSGGNSFGIMKGLLTIPCSSSQTYYAKIRICICCAHCYIVLYQLKLFESVVVNMISKQEVECSSPGVALCIGAPYSPIEGIVYIFPCGAYTCGGLLCPLIYFVILLSIS